MRERAKPIPQTEYMAMRQAFAQKFGEPEDKHVPAKEYIERKLHELETGEFRAEPLNEVLSRGEIDPDTLVPQWDSKGTSLVLKKATSKGAVPSGPEQLRLRLTVMQNALLMIGLQHPGIRKQAYKQTVLKGIGFADALVQSWKDAATKERQFATPLSLCANLPQPWSWDNNKPDKPGKKGKGKGGKGKDSNKKAKITKDTFNRTEDNKPI